MELGASAYAGVFVASLALSLVLTPLAIRIATRHGVLDEPRAHKAHADPVPYLGGAAITISFAAAIVAAAMLRPPTSGLRELLTVIGVAVVLSLVGLLDDLRGLGPFLRLAVEIGGAVAVWYAGVRVELFQVEVANLALTVVWIVGITNAFNLLDNMDGLSAGVAGVAAGGFFLLAAVNGQFLVAGLSVALAGCALGFLRSNFHPARIYMGDSGSLFLGFILAVIGIKLRFDADREISLFVPVLVLGVAIFDTTLVTVARIVNRRNPLRGGRDHASHRLVFVGVPVPVAVAMIYGAGLALSWIALIVSRVDTGTAALVMGLVLTVAVIAGLLLGVVPVYEHSSRRRLMLQEVVDHEAEPPAAPGPDAPSDEAEVEALA